MFTIQQLQHLQIFFFLNYAQNMQGDSTSTVVWSTQQEATEYKTSRKESKFRLHMQGPQKILIQVMPSNVLKLKGRWLEQNPES